MQTKSFIKLYGSFPWRRYRAEPLFAASASLKVISTSLNKVCYHEGCLCEKTNLRIQRVVPPSLMIFVFDQISGQRPLALILLMYISKDFFPFSSWYLIVSKVNPALFNAGTYFGGILTWLYISEIQCVSFPFYLFYFLLLKVNVLGDLKGIP